MSSLFCTRTVKGKASRLNAEEKSHKYSESRKKNYLFLKSF